MRIRIDGNGRGRIFQGIGGVFSNGMTKLLEDYPREQREDILRYLFEDNFGAALQHVKVEIGSDVNTSSGTVPSHMRSRQDYDIKRGSELWIAALARSINPAITMEALRWGTPSWIRDDRDKYLYYLNFLKGAEEEFGIRFGYLGCDQNEGSFDRDWVVNTLAPGLEKDGYGDIRLVAAESDSSWQIAEEALTDAALDRVCEVFNCHYTVESTETAIDSGKPLWAGEHLAGMRHDFAAGALSAAYNMLAMYPLGRMTMYEMHPALEANYPSTPFNYKGMIAASWPWSGHYEVTPGLWTTAHFTQFIKPGWQYLDGACKAGNEKDGEEKCGYVTLKAPDGKNWSMVLINCTDSAKEYCFQIEGDLKNDRLHVWKTDEAESFRQLEDKLPENGAFCITLPPYTMYSLTTTQGQRKGSPASDIPEDKTMALPWTDDFTAYEEGSQPLYTSDQGGAFEVSDRKGTAVLEQKITQETKPVDWVYRTTPYPCTLIGSELWADYTVEAEVLLPEENSFGYVAGRCANNGQFDNFPQGYVFCVQGDGTWKLQRQEDVLLSGRLNSFERQSFHRLTIGFDKDRIMAAIDGESLGHTVDSFLSAGQAALGSSYHEVCFQALKISAQEPCSCKRYPELDSRIQWTGDWRRKDGYYTDFGRRKVYSEESGSTMEFTFDGTGACITGSRDRNGGTAQVYVDGEWVKMIDCYCTTDNDRKTGLSIPKARNAVAAVYGLKSGVHVLKLVVDGKSGPASQGCVVAVDAVEISGGTGLMPR